MTREKQVDIVVLDMPLLDTRQGRDLTGALIADILLQLLSYVAQTEREFNRQRQAEGIAAAKAKGIHFGRKFKERGENYESVMAAWRRGEISGRAAARELGGGSRNLPAVVQRINWDYKVWVTIRIKKP